MMTISPELLVLGMFGGMLALLLTGYPLAIILAAIGVLFGYLLIGPGVFDLFVLRSYDVLASFTWMAVPLFVFMGTMVQTSGVAEKLYNTFYILMGGARGGLAIATIAIGTVLAACVGLIAASLIMIALLAMPAMLSKGYDRSFAAGAVCAGGSLGILIPPSILLIVYGPAATMSVGKLFLAAFPAGLVLSLLYTSYAAIRAFLQPHLAPAMPMEERSMVSRGKLASMLLTSFVPPVVLVLAVLGSIFFGIASPTEAAGVGALAAVILAASYRSLTRTVMKDAALGAMRLTGMVAFIALAANLFTAVFDLGGGSEVISSFVLSMPFGKWGSLFAILLIVFLLGMVMDWPGIVFIMVPIATPIGQALGFDSLWFAMMIIVTIQTGFMTPPFACTIFYLKGCARPEWGLTTAHIIRGVLPYVGLILLSLVTFTVFPDILLWLPAHMIQ